MNLPNQLTVARCLLALVFVGLLSFNSLICFVIAYGVFTVAALTDYYDGKIARQRGMITNFGKLLDPVADKVLIVSAFVMLMTIPELRIPGWTIVAILSREFLVTGARSLAASDGAVIAASGWGKVKTVVQMVYVFTFFFLVIALRFAGSQTWLAEALPGGYPLYESIIGYASTTAIILVSLYTVFSGIQFARDNWKALRLSEGT